MENEDIELEERGIYLVILGASIPIVIGTLLAHEVFDAGSTICLGLFLLGLVGLAGLLLHRRARLPTARSRERLKS